MQACGGSRFQNHCRKPEPGFQLPLQCLQIAIELVLGLDRSWLSPERLVELRGLFGDWLEGFTSTFAVDMSWTGGCVVFAFFAALLWAQHEYCACMHLSDHACTSPVPELHSGAALKVVHAATFLLHSRGKGALGSSGERRGVFDLFSLPRSPEQHQQCQQLSTNLSLRCSILQALMMAPAA